MNKNKIILKSTLVVGMLLNPIFSMEKELTDSSDQLYQGWEMIENSNDPIITIDNNEDDFELKAKALCNTALTFFGGAAVAVCDLGVRVIENTIQHRVNQFEAGVALGTLTGGYIYGQGVALNNAYENEKSKLKNQ